MKKLSIANVRELSKMEMKKIMAGSSSGPCSGDCIGSIGAWNYNEQATWAACAHDITVYCSSGEGTCYGC